MGWDTMDQFHRHKTVYNRWGRPPFHIHIVPFLGTNFDPGVMMWDFRIKPSCSLLWSFAWNSGWFAHFVMEEWNKQQYDTINGWNTVYINHSGKCITLMNTDSGRTSQLQYHHEKVDTNIVFHRRIVMWSSETDVLVIFIGLSGGRKDWV